MKCANVAEETLHPHTPLKIPVPILQSISRSIPIDQPILSPIPYHYNTVGANRKSLTLMIPRNTKSTFLTICTLVSFRNFLLTLLLSCPVNQSLHHPSFTSPNCAQVFLFSLVGHPDRPCQIHHHYARPSVREPYLYDPNWRSFT